MESVIKFCFHSAEMTPFTYKAYDKYQILHRTWFLPLNSTSSKALILCQKKALFGCREQGLADATTQTALIRQQGKVIISRE